MSVVLETQTKETSVTWRQLLKNAREIEQTRGLNTFRMHVDSDWKSEVNENGNDKMITAVRLFTQELRGRFVLYKYFGMLDNHAAESITDECTEPLLEEKVQFYNIFKQDGLHEAEKYAEKVIRRVKPELQEPKKLADNLLLYRKESEHKLYSLYDHINEYGNYIQFEQSLWKMKDKIEADLGEKFNEMVASTGMRDTMQFFADPMLGAYDGEEQIKEYIDLYDYAMKNSKTIRKIQADICNINNYTKSVLERTKLLYRGGSIDEVFKLERHHGKTGYHKRGIASMKSKDFTSTSVFPDIALSFSSHDFIPINEGIIMEYNVSGMSESDVKPVQYDLRGKCMQWKQSQKRDIFWTFENFGGYYDPSFIQQAEVHLKKGSVPVVTRVWINPKLNKDKKHRVVSILAKLNPDIEVYYSELID